MLSKPIARRKLKTMLLTTPTNHDTIRSVMGEFDALAEEIYKDKVRRARAMSPEEKFLAGQELFDFACKFTLAGIAAQHPGADEKERLRLLRQRLALGEKLDWLSAPAVPPISA